MRPGVCLAALTACARLGFLPVPALAQGAGTPGWSVRLVPLVFLSNVNGVSGVEDLEIPVGDSVLRAGVAVHLEVWRGHWGALAEFTRAGVQGEAAPGGETGPPGAFDLRISSLEIAAGFRVGQVPVRSAVELLAGARWVKHVEDLDLESDRRTLQGKIGEEWVEPFVGARFVSALGGPFRFAVLGTIAGGGLGSDFDWMLDGELGLRLFRYGTLVGRYRYSESEYDRGDGGYRWDDGQVQGWLFGLGLDL